MTQITRPALRYYGGKWAVADWVIRHFPHHDCYVEPYGGAGSVLLNKQPSPLEVLNDLDGETVNFFRVLREQPEALMRAIELTPFSREEYECSYRIPEDAPPPGAGAPLCRAQLAGASRAHLAVEGRLALLSDSHQRRAGGEGMGPHGAPAGHRAAPQGRADRAWAGP